MTIFTQASLSCMRLACKSRSNENGVAMACCGLQMRSTVLHKTETVSFPSPPQVRLGHWPEWRDWPLGSLHSTTALTVHVHVACACLVWLLLLIQLRPRGIGGDPGSSACIQPSPLCCPTKGNRRQTRRPTLSLLSSLPLVPYLFHLILPTSNRPYLAKEKRAIPNYISNTLFIELPATSILHSKSLITNLGRVLFVVVQSSD
jgi:hypothetical protein